VGPHNLSGGKKEISEKLALRSSKYQRNRTPGFRPNWNIGIAELDYWKIGIMEYWLLKTKKLINSFSSSKPIVPVFHYSSIPCGLFPPFHHSMRISQIDRDKKL